MKGTPRMKPTISPSELQAKVRPLLPGIVELRRRLHAMPELRFREFNTAKEIREHLGRLPNVCLRPALIGTDTVGLLRGNTPGRCVLLRADIDALRIRETTGVPYASKTPGMSHACGHDGHAAILAGSMELLAGLTDRFAGSVVFVFQPAEEEAGGGRKLVEAGLLDIDPVPEAAFALHGQAGLPVGIFTSRAGAVMAAADRFTIRVMGRGGHGGAPQQTVDPVVLSAQVITALQTIPSRRLNPNHPAVVSVCMIHGGESSNIIPDEVEMQGTVRYFDVPVRDKIKLEMERILAGLAASADARIDLDYRPGYIPTRNAPKEVAFASEVIRAYLGEDRWRWEEEPSTGAEDFAYYLEKIPGAYLHLGIGTDRPTIHHPGFDFNDAALEPGILALTALALEFLNRP